MWRHGRHLAPSGGKCMDRAPHLGPQSCRLQSLGWKSACHFASEPSKAMRLAAVEAGGAAPAMQCPPPLPRQVCSPFHTLPQQAPPSAAHAPRPPGRRHTVRSICSSMQRVSVPNLSCVRPIHTRPAARLCPVRPLPQRIMHPPIGCLRHTHPPASMLYALWCAPCGQARVGTRSTCHSHTCCTASPACCLTLASLRWACMSVPPTHLSTQPAQKLAIRLTRRRGALLVAP